MSCPLEASAVEGGDERAGPAAHAISFFLFIILWVAAVLHAPPAAPPNGGTFTSGTRKRRRCLPDAFLQVFICMFRSRLDTVAVAAQDRTTELGLCLERSMSCAFLCSSSRVADSPIPCHPSTASGRASSSVHIRSRSKVITAAQRQRHRPPAMYIRPYLDLEHTPAYNISQHVHTLR